MTYGYLACSFDLLNVRHLDLIAQASTSCDRLVVGVLTDEHAEALHGRRPVVPLRERLDLIRHVRSVAEVIVHTESALERGFDALFGVTDEYVDLPGDVIWLEPVRVSASQALCDAVRTDAA